MPGAAVRRHPRHVLLVAIVAGLLCGGTTPGTAVTVTVAGGLGALVAVAGARPGMVLVVPLLVIASGGAAQARVDALERTRLGPLVGHVARGEVTVTAAPRPSAFGGWTAVAEFRGEPVLLRVSAARSVGAPPARSAATEGGVPGRGAEEGDGGTDGGVASARGGTGDGRAAPGPPPFAVGDILAVRVAVRPPDDYARILRAHAVLRTLALRRAGRTRGGVDGLVDHVRRRAERALAHDRDPTRVALLQGMVLGQDAGLPTSVRDDVRAAGLSHLTAASGANIVLLSTLVLALAALLGVPFRARWLVVLALITLYVPLAGGGPSIQRAGVMGAAGVVATLAGRPSARWYAIGLAAVATLARDPRTVGDPGWQLSFAAVAALAVFAAPWARRLEVRGVPGPAAEALAVTAAATLVTAPVIAAHFDRVAPLSLPANLLVAPLVAPIMWLGFTAAAVGPLLPPAAALLDALAGPLLGLIVTVAHIAASAPGAQVSVPGGVATTLLVTLAALAALGVRAPLRLGAARRLPAAAPAAVLALTVTAAAWARRPRPPAPPPPPSTFRVTFLDVGQGDATLLEVPGHAVLVDTGPPDGDVVGQLRASGIRRLDAVVVSHAQADHEGGTAAVLRAFPVGLVVDGRDGVRSPLGEAFARTARTRHVALAPPTAGDRLTLGRLTVRILSPGDGPTSGASGADPNDRAIVAEATAAGARVLLTADAESDILRRLALRRVDVLKVAHHGSADAGLPELLQQLRPLVAGIEVGAHNTYGHPAPATLSALRAAVPRTVRTDRDGRTRLDLIGPGRWTVRTSG